MDHFILLPQNGNTKDASNNDPPKSASAYIPQCVSSYPPPEPSFASSLYPPPPSYEEVISLNIGQPVPRLVPNYQKSKIKDILNFIKYTSIIDDVSGDDDQLELMSKELLEGMRAIRDNK